MGSFWSFVCFISQVAPNTTWLVHPSWLLIVLINPAEVYYFQVPYPILDLHKIRNNKKVPSRLQMLLNRAKWLSWHSGKVLPAIRIICLIIN